MKIVYGPVVSWRLGHSLGIDMLCTRGKRCSFDCVYCQLGRTKNPTVGRQRFVAVRDLEQELQNIPETIEYDVVTFSGMGEPTLAKNLPPALRIVREFTNRPIAVLTNSSLMSDERVRRELADFDIVVAKLDARDQELFHRVNRPARAVRFEAVMDGLEAFRRTFEGKLAVQIMLIEMNKSHAKDLDALTRLIDPDEVQLNTPLRPSAVPPLSPREMQAAAVHFKGLNVRQVYDYAGKRLHTDVLEQDEVMIRRPDFLKGSVLSGIQGRQGDCQ